jgi:hypothetical protein
MGDICQFHGQISVLILNLVQARGQENTNDLRVHVKSLIILGTASSGRLGERRRAVSVGAMGQGTSREKPTVEFNGVRVR